MASLSLQPADRAVVGEEQGAEMGIGRRISFGVKHEQPFSRKPYATRRRLCVSVSFYFSDLRIC